MIKINANKKYGDRVVLDVDLEFEEGKRYALIGANGSGKSTLLKILDGQLKAKGEKQLNGADNVGYMPQNSYAFSMSLKSNVFLACPDASRFDRKTRIYYNDRCFELIDKMGLWKLRYKNAAKLSGGETQRMALCRTLVMKHDMLLLDEPTSAMDVAAAVIAENVIEEYCKTFAPTVIFATHSLKQAARLADEVLFLHDGKVIERGIPDEILTNPQSEDLKTFLLNV